MQLAKTAKSLLAQLEQLLGQLSSDVYNSDMEILSGSSIGKHIRHVLEIFKILLESYDGACVCYDNRSRDLRLENDKLAALESINFLLSVLEKQTDDKLMVLEVRYAGDEKVAVDTTYHRELAYNIEHTIHHMAIIKMAIISAIPDVHLPDDFGVAYSTMRHIKAS